MVMGRGGCNTWGGSRIDDNCKGGERIDQEPEAPSTNPGTRVEPQQIVAQRLLSCVQYPVLVKSSTEDLTRPTFCITVKYCVDPKAIGTPTPVEGASSLPAWILS